MWWLAGIAAAATPYGVGEGGRPTSEQRLLHVVTNLVRVAPRAFEADYGCSIAEFSPSELQPRAPLRYHDGLADIAQQHTEDMAAHGFLDHDSSDGTSFSERVWPYYDGNVIGENVAVGYRDAWSTVLDGWMCSAAHRENLVSPDFDDLGTGVAGDYATQDFGGGAAGPAVPVAMAAEEVGAQGTTVWATWWSDAAPAELWVETDDDCVAMGLWRGEPEGGGYVADLGPLPDCAAWRLRWIEPDGTAGFLPEEGAYLAGTACPAWDAVVPRGCEASDEDAAGGTSTGEPAGVEPPAGTEAAGCGCGSAGPAGGSAAVLAVLLALRRRRRLVPGPA